MNKKSVLLNAMLVVVSTIVSLAVAELALRTIIRPRAVLTREMLRGLGVSDAEQNWDRDPDLGWVIKPNQTFRHVNPAGEFNIEVRTDERRFRIPLTGAKAEPADRTILFIGDSVTAAYEVEYEQSFVAKVEQELRKTEKVSALNAGVRGYSSEQSLKRLRQILDSGLKVDDVVYLFSLNDPFENMSLHFPKRLMSKPAAYLDQDGKLEFLKPDHELGVLDSEATFVGPNGSINVLPVVGWEPSRRVVGAKIKYKPPANILERSYLYTLAEMAFETYLLPHDDIAAVNAKYPYIKASYIKDDDGGFMPGDIDISWTPNSYPLQLLDAIIHEMQMETARRGVRFLVALPLTASPPMVKYFHDVTAKYGIALSDPTPTTQHWVDQCGGSLVFRTDGHYTACGHSAQAAALSDALRQTLGH